MYHSTKWQELKHAVGHFTKVYVPLLLLMKVYFPAENVIRKLWWKAWGYDPSDVSFHLGKLKFDAASMNQMKIGMIITQFADYIYGKESKWGSAAYMSYIIFRNNGYLKFFQYKPLYDIHTNDQPGADIIKWFLETDSISKTKLDWMLQNKEGFATWYGNVLEERMYTEEEYAENVRQNLANRQAEVEREEQEGTPK